MRDLTEGEKLRLEKALVANVKLWEERVLAYQADPKHCKNCGVILEYNARKKTFCSRSCSASFNNHGSPHNIKDGRYAKKPCCHCGVDTDNIRYCSSECFHAAKREKRIKRYKESGIFDGMPGTVKSYLIETKGHRCDICGGEAWRDKPIPLVLDHINGKPSDWRSENLRLVCGNCNMQLPTFAGKNVGKGGGRPYRLKRYHEGKSY
jgi:protein-arginine kinase activator protein McsA